MSINNATQASIVKVLNAVTTLVQLGIVYLTFTWGYQLIHFVTTTLLKPFLGGAL